MHTPFFSAWRPRLAALGRRTAQTLRQATLAQLSEHVRQILPAALLASTDEGDNSRDRVFNLRFTFECFVWQMLKPGTACREVVRHVQALLRLQNRPPIEEDNSAYVQARQRLPLERMEAALKATAQAADLRASPSCGQWQGRPVKVVDASSTQLPDTAENQKRYPQPSGQKPGCGFPVMKFLALFSLASGAILEVLFESLRSHDLRLFRRLWEYLKPGDIALGDRAFGDYATLAGLPRQQVDVLARLHARRKVDFRKAKRLAQNDGLFVWRKPGQRPDYLSEPEWAALPEQITVRIVRFTATIRGQRARRITLVTTLLEAKVYPAEQLAALYARRWRLELCFRDLKTTLGMEQLSCKSPEMVQKEALAFLIAHNLIRCVMAEAAARFEADLERISFKGSVDALRQYSEAIGKARNRKQRSQLWDDLLLNLARDLVPLRLGRHEPRAVKRRPKPYPLLNKPRHRFKEIPHRNRYHKNKPRNYRTLN